MIDEAVFGVKAGNGGDGAVSFRREKYAPKGGPDGGDGGNGGSVWLVARKGINTLSFFAGKDRFEAQNGGKGSKRKRHGFNAEDIELSVPVGTVVYEDYVGNEDEQTAIQRGLEESLMVVANSNTHSFRQLFDLTEDGQRVCLVKGGIGGRGNWHFRSSTNTTPQEYEEGTKGEERQIKLELKVLAQVGLVGLPNAGKSTLLSVLTKAQPKIANYPFTTLTPNLGAMQIPGKKDHLILADIPGIIEGASTGKGLGVRFLKHIERCRVLVYVIGVDSVLEAENEVAASPVDLAGRIRDQFVQVQSEIAAYSTKLLELPYMVVVNKVDILPEDDLKLVLESVSKWGKDVIPVSSATGIGIEKLKTKMVQLFESLY